VRLLDALRHLWGDVVHRDRAERELDDELRSWIDLSVMERVRRGADPRTARREVMAEMRGVDAVKDAVRETRLTHGLESWVQDVRYALRSFRRAPLFTLTVLLVLILGIGGTTGAFSVIRATLLSPLGGVRDPESLVAFDRWEGSDRYDGFSYPDLEDYRARLGSFSGIAAYVPAPFSAVLGRSGGERLRGALVTGDYFTVLGVEPAAGRLLGPDDDRPGRSNVVVISDGLWRRAFGADAHVVGSTLRLDGQGFTVVGVVAPRFRGVELGEATDVWAPLAAQPVLLSRMSAGIMESRSAGWLGIFGRLSPGVTLPAAAEQARGVAAELAAEYPETNAGRTVTLRGGVGLAPDDRSALVRMLGLTGVAAVLLLLVACANVAGLVTARSASRRKEMAARVALGASRLRLVRQLFVEGAVLGAVGGGLALAVAEGLVSAALRLQPPGSLLRYATVSLDPAVFAVASLATLMSVALFTLSPALQAVAADPMEALREGRPGAGGAKHRGHRYLVTAQVALSFALVVSAVTVTSAIRGVLTRSPGFDPEGVVVASIDLTAEGFAPARGEALYDRLISRLDVDPSFRSASFAKTVPPRDWSDRVSLFEPGSEPTQQYLRDHEMQLGFRVQLDRVAPRYFATLGVPLLQGRDFTRGDDATAPGVAIVNESLARALWPGADPIGRRVSWPSLDGPPRPPLEVVGVVADHRYTSLTTAAAPLVYVPVLQAYDGRATVVARAAHGTREALGALRGVFRELDPDVAVFGVTTMRERMTDSVWAPRTLAAWLTVFAALALVLSLVGIYGVVAQAVARRSRELSVRLALGARPGEVVRAVVAEGALLAGAGLAVGLPVAVTGYAFALRQLAGMEAGGWLPWAAGALLLFATSLAASWAPARRAAVNPADALRSD
jgi:predicted permease